MLVEEVVVDAAVQDPFDGGGLERHQRSRRQPKGRTHGAQEGYRVAHMFDHMARDHDVSGHLGVARPVVVGDEAEPPSRPLLGATVRRVETEAGAARSGDQLLEEVAIAATDLDYLLVLADLRPQVFDQTVDVTLERRRADLVVVVVLPVFDQVMAEGRVGDEVATRAVSEGEITPRGSACGVCGTHDQVLVDRDSPPLEKGRRQNGLAYRAGVHETDSGIIAIFSQCSTTRSITAPAS